jgi:hypothetical protein
MSLSYEDVMDEVSHAFTLETIKRQVYECEDIDALRKAIIELVDMSEKQKALFKHLLVDAIESGQVEVTIEEIEEE